MSKKSEYRNKPLSVFKNNLLSIVNKKICGLAAGRKKIYIVDVTLAVGRLYQRWHQVTISRRQVRLC